VPRGPRPPRVPCRRSCARRRRRWSRSTNARAGRPQPWYARPTLYRYLTADSAARSHPAGKLVSVSPPDAIDQFLADRSGGHGTKALLIARCHLCSAHWPRAAWRRPRSRSALNSRPTEYGSTRSPPDVIDTPMHPDDAHPVYAGIHPLGRMGSFADIVRGVLYRESAAFVTGEFLHVTAVKALAARPRSAAPKRYGVTAVPTPLMERCRQFAPSPHSLLGKAARTGSCAPIRHQWACQLAPWPCRLPCWPPACTPHSAWWAWVARRLVSNPLAAVLACRAAADSPQNIW